MVFSAKILFAMLLLSFCSLVYAATYINFTRLILNETEREVTFQIKNEGDNAVLMQLWIDRDNIMDKPEVIKTPFLVSPPVFRLDGKESRIIRLQFIDDKNLLAKNTESLFWLNALEIPRKAKGKEGAALLQVAFRTRIKVFYRPLALAQLNTEQQLKNINVLKISCDDKYCIRIKNRTPFHYSLLKVTLTNGKEINDLPQDGMILPYSFMDISSEKIVGTNQDIKSLTWIDDFGVERISLR